MHSYNVNMHDANAIVKNLIPNISNKGQISLIPKGYRRPILKIEHMTWTYDPKPDPKKTLHVGLIDTDASISILYFLLFGYLMPHRFLRFVFASRFANCAPLWA